MWNPLSHRPRRLTLRQLVVALHQKMDLAMSALDDLKAAVAKNDVGIAHIADLMREVSDRLAADPENIDADEIEAIAKHLSEGADQLQGFTIVPPQTSGVPGAQTANAAPDTPPDAGTPPTAASAP